MEDFPDTTDVGASMHTCIGIGPILPRWGGEWLVGWQLVEVGPLGTPVII